MSETPLIQKLDDDVRRFVGKQLKREGVVTGWVLAVASSRFDDDGDVCYAWDYSVGPDTDLIRAVGLIEAARLSMRRDLGLSGPREDDDDG